MKTKALKRITIAALLLFTTNGFAFSLFGPAEIELQGMHIKNIDMGKIENSERAEGDRYWRQRARSYCQAAGYTKGAQLLAYYVANKDSQPILKDVVCTSFGVGVGQKNAKAAKIVILKDLIERGVITQEDLSSSEKSLLKTEGKDIIIDADSMARTDASIERAYLPENIAESLQGVNPARTQQRRGAQ